MKYEVWFHWNSLPGSHAGGVYAHPVHDDVRSYHVGHTLYGDQRFLGTYPTMDAAKLAHPDLIDERK